MVRFLRFALIPVVLFCLTILAAAFDSISTNLQQKATWLPVMATVVDAQEFGELGATLSGRAADFPDPYGEISYTVGGETYQWQGRARDIGFVSLPVGGDCQHLLRSGGSQPDQQPGAVGRIGRVDDLRLGRSLHGFLRVVLLAAWSRRSPAGHAFDPG